MKKITSILLLLTLVFNWYGYRFLFNWLQQKADAKLEASLDQNHYAEADLMEISVPLNMPYQTNWAGFERVNGEITIDGVHYKYVKRKIDKGHLVLKCIPHPAKQQVLNARDSFFQLVNDLQQESPAKKSNSSGSMAKLNISEYEEQFGISFPVASMVVKTALPASPDDHIVSTWFDNTPEQPPEQAIS